MVSAPQSIQLGSRKDRAHRAGLLDVKVPLDSATNRAPGQMPPRRSRGPSAKADPIHPTPKGVDFLGFSL
jgi:hypothetical protein